MGNPYIPELALIEDMKRETHDVKTLTISFKNERLFNPLPGQFIQVSVFGYGEFPSSISAVLDPEKGCLQTTVRRVGKATAKLLDLPANSTIGIRGPFGNGFPVAEMEGKNILLLAGGTGLTSIKYLALYLLENRDRYGDLKLLYGAKTPGDLLFRDSPLLNEKGAKGKGFEVLLTVDEPDEEWKGNVGVVTELLDKTEVTPDNASAIICGPSVMMKFATRKFIDIGFDEAQVILSFERRMQCGIGMCGHCMMGQKRVCLDGPVFTYKDVKDTLERLF